MQTIDNLPQEEIRRRVRGLQSALAEAGVDGAIILQNVDIYYYAGTIQPSMLFIPVEGSPVLIVLKNFPRAKLESGLDTIIAARLQ